jgi:hypothetical protein
MQKRAGVLLGWATRAVAAHAVAGAVITLIVLHVSCASLRWQ